MLFTKESRIINSILQMGKLRHRPESASVGLVSLWGGLWLEMQPEWRGCLQTHGSPSHGLAWQGCNMAKAKEESVSSGCFGGVWGKKPFSFKFLMSIPLIQRASAPGEQSLPIFISFPASSFHISLLRRSSHLLGRKRGG